MRLRRFAQTAAHGAAAWGALFALLLAAAAALPAQVALAAEEWGDGVSNEYEYREVLVLSGEPVVVSGKRQVTESAVRSAAGGAATATRLTFKLENPEKKVKVTRTLSLVTETSPGPAGTNGSAAGQRVRTTRVDRFTETITFGREQYRLEDYRFHKSVVVDQRPVVAYFSGNFTERKIYSVNRNQGTITVQAVGETVGYDHHWGSTETQRVTYTIDATRRSATGSSAWSGTVQAQNVWTTAKELVYVPVEPSTISFPGGYLLTQREDSTMRYHYDLPALDAQGQPQAGVRNTGEIQDRLETVPRQQRLSLVHLRDVPGHWAQGSIERLHALGVLATAGDYFGPRLPMSRAEFARALAVATGLGDPSGATPAARPVARGAKQPPLEVSPFTDVATSDQNYRYIKAVRERGIITGIDDGVFFPSGPLTRAQAVTILVRALGLEGKAPTPGYASPYPDDAEIPAWARDAVYVASEIGLARGDSFGYFRPGDVMTKAEATVLMDRFIDFLRAEIAREYRDRLLRF